MSINVFELKNVYKTYDENLLEDVSLSASNKDRIVLVGKNGVGKSTLCKIIKGEECIDSGNINLNNKTIVSLQQNMKEDLLIKDYISDVDIKKFWTFSKIFNVDNLPLTRTLSNLSGGERTKIMLSVLFSIKSDFIILDEPTNHLDIKSIMELKKILKSNTLPFLIISHDAFFLKDLTNRVFYIKDKKVVTHNYPYDIFIEEQIKTFQRLKKDYDVDFKNRVKTKKKRKEILKKFESKRIESLKKLVGVMKKKGGRLKRAEKPTITAKRLLTKLEQSNSVDKPFCVKDIKYRFTKEEKTHGTIEFNDALIGYDEFKLSISTSVEFGEKICFFGANGQGKTLIIKSILSKGGKYLNKGSINISKNIRTSSINQFFDNKNITVNEFFTNETIDANPKEFLVKIRLNKNILNKKLNEISSGEMIKLFIAIIMAKNSNTLILDEPTNHLDIEAVNLLKQYINNFPATVILTSHNIDFINSINFDKIYLIENKKIKYIKSFSEYLSKYQDI